MKIISHRGNLNGPNPLTENTEEQIDLCISKGYDVEIDVWCINEDFFLGHDKPTNKISITFLLNRKKSLWIHCKNLECLFILNNLGLNYFWHQEDDFTLTSQEFIWTYPNKRVSYINQVVLDFSENVSYEFYRSSGVYGVCVDYVEDIK
jgi:hypothetical protein